MFKLAPTEVNSERNYKLTSYKAHKLLSSAQYNFFISFPNYIFLRTKK